MPEVVRKAFKVAQTEKPGGAFIEFPENIAESKVEGVPIEVQTAYTSAAPDSKDRPGVKDHLGVQVSRNPGRKRSDPPRRGRSVGPLR